MSDPLSIAVVGAGLMGHGIALTMAHAGHQVRLSDPQPDSLASASARILTSLTILGTSSEMAQATLGRITLTAKLSEAVRDADIVFEAAPEKLALKQQIFAEIEAHAPPGAILASNTSVIPITQIMERLKHRERALGTHWWNPPHIVPLVEVIRTKWTADAPAQRIFALLAQAGKVPVMVKKDVPGFIGNRLQHALWREAISLVERGICSAEAVDTVIKFSFGRRLAVLGPLENADLVGTDLTLNIHENVLADLENRPGPSPYLRDLVAQGRLGMKSGEGFRNWTPEQAEAIRTRMGHYLIELERLLDEIG